MSKIQDLIDLNMSVPGESIFDDSDEVIYGFGLDDAIVVLNRNIEDRDPIAAEDGGWSGVTSSVTINFKGGIYKSHEVEGSYGQNSWSSWKQAKPVPVITYLYDESTY
jgi:hypothetical protein